MCLGLFVFTALITPDFPLLALTHFLFCHPVRNSWTGGPFPYRRGPIAPFSFLVVAFLVVVMVVVVVVVGNK